MKLTKKNVKWFEKEQKTYGTEVALHNWVWLIAVELLEDLGISKVVTTSKNPLNNGNLAGREVKVALP